jgi:hypothetical protein
MPQEPVLALQSRACCAHELCFAAVCRGRSPETFEVQVMFFC